MQTECGQEMKVNESEPQIPPQEKQLFVGCKPNRFYYKRLEKRQH